MAYSTITGIVLGLALLAGVIGLSADNPGLFVNWPGLLLVFGGTFAATLMSFPATRIGEAFTEFLKSMTSDRSGELEHHLSHMKQIIPILRSGNLNQMEKVTAHIHSPFFHDGVQMVIDGVPAEDITFLMDWRMDAHQQNMRAKAGVFRAMAGFAPAFGMVGTLLGLVNMLSTMNSDALETIGASMALALITTFYGLVLANALLKPMALTIEQKLQHDLALLMIAREAVLFLHQQKHPSYAQDLLNKLMEHHEREVA